MRKEEKWSQAIRCESGAGNKEKIEWKSRWKVVDRTDRQSRVIKRENRVKNGVRKWEKVNVEVASEIERRVIRKRRAKFKQRQKT